MYVSCVILVVCASPCRVPDARSEFARPLFAPSFVLSCCSWQATGPTLQRLLCPAQKLLRTADARGKKQHQCEVSPRLPAPDCGTIANAAHCKCGAVAGRNVLFGPCCGNVPAPSWMLSVKTTHGQLLRHIPTCNNTTCPAPVPPPALPPRPAASHFERCEFTLPAVSPWPQCSDRKYRKPYVHQFTRGTLGYRQAHAEHFCTLPTSAHAPGQHVGCAPPLLLVRGYNRG
jgi:hypothetical protein